MGTIEAMQRRWLLIVALVAACGGNDHALPDAPQVDAHHPDAAGSGSAVASVLEPSPRDHGLEVVVVVSSLVVVIGPVRARRRREREPYDDDSAPRT